MKSRYIKVIGFTTVGLSLLIGILIYKSPYTYKNNKAIIESKVSIKNNCENVFSYLGNSDNASKWSVFVDSIIPLNQYDFEDGSPLSKRRCFTGGEDEFMWDEEILTVVPNDSRTLKCYNFQNLYIESSELITEQKYKPTFEGCEVTFTLKYRDQNVDWFEHAKLKFIGYYIDYIFSRNLENIKNENERSST